MSVNRPNADAPKIHCRGIGQGLLVNKDLQDPLDQRVSRDLRDLPDLGVSKAPLGLPALRVSRDHPAPNRTVIRTHDPKVLGSSLSSAAKQIKGLKIKSKSLYLFSCL